MIATSRSRKIYGELNNGRVINRYLFDGDRLKENPLYQEILHNKVEYTQMYDRLGFELAHCEGFFFIRDADVTDPHREATVKVVALLSILGQATIQQGYRYSLLTEEGAGFSSEMALEADGKEEYQDIKAAIGLKGSLWQEMKNILVDRRIAYLNNSGRLMLSDCGKSFFQHQFDGCEPKGSKKE